MKDLKTFIITISSNKDSYFSTQQAIESAKKVGYKENIEIFEAVLPNQWFKILPWKNDFLKYDKPDNVAACFASHYLLWQKCIELNEPILILEHDVIFKSNIPDIDFNMCVTLGRPSYLLPYRLEYNETKNGLQPLTQKHFIGHHAYSLKPEAAKIFCKDVETSVKTGRLLCANDVWMDKSNYNFLQEYRPFPIIADNDFSTIQKAFKIKPEFANNTILQNYEHKFPKLKCFQKGTKENIYLHKHFSHLLENPQSKRFIDP